MKRFFWIAFVLVVAASGSASAQAHAHGADSAKSGHSMEHMSGWKELDAYHAAMMKVWHPAKEKNDLAPIKAQAAELATAADAWAKATVPTSCDTPINRVEIAGIQADSRALASLVTKGTDAAIKDALKALHDRFETVNRACQTHHQ